MFQNSLHGLVLCTAGTAFTWRCKIAFRHTNVIVCILTHIYIHIYVYVYMFMYIYLYKRCSTSVGYIKEYKVYKYIHLCSRYYAKFVFSTFGTAFPCDDVKKKCRYSKSHLGWHFRMLFQKSKLKARTSLLPRFSEKRSSNFELWALKELSKMSPQVGLAVHMCMWYTYICIYIHLYISTLCDVCFQHLWHGISRNAVPKMLKTNVAQCIYIQMNIYTYICVSYTHLCVHICFYVVARKCRDKGAENKGRTVYIYRNEFTHMYTCMIYVLVCASMFLRRVNTYSYICMYI